ncbi:MAG TPA: YggS family pyridoxal phosphate-dependent enzyme [Actinomycetota bacterium]|nr:YggS family pyridoxal phosphate-dependent enzyme [Actinomycetota bacterium]
MSVADAVAEVRGRIAAACERSGRDPGEVTLVAVSKGFPASSVDDVVRCGVGDLGENRAQELRDKGREVATEPRWHFLGPLQTNKVRYLDEVTLIHSVDRTDEVEALQARASRTGRSYDVLVEVNVSGEPTKQGLPPEELRPFLDTILGYTLVRPRGLMMMAPMVENPEDVRWMFAEARHLRDRVRDVGLEELSMGMTDDFEVAVEEGATFVRIGRAIFGRR